MAKNGKSPTNTIRAQILLQTDDAGALHTLNEAAHDQCPAYLGGAMRCLYWRINWMQKA